MATVRNNPIVNGWSGMFGQALVFKSYNGRTFVSSKPKPPRKQSGRQLANRSRFRMASHWAQVILQDPERKAYYQKKAKALGLPNAYTAAITDYMREPRLKKGPKINERVICEVGKRDFELARVEVALIKEGVTETRTVAKNKNNSYLFALSAEDLLMDICISATDSSGRLNVIYL